MTLPLSKLIAGRLVGQILAARNRPRIIPPIALLKVSARARAACKQSVCREVLVAESACHLSPTSYSG